MCVRWLLAHTFHLISCIFPCKRSIFPDLIAIKDKNFGFLAPQATKLGSRFFNLVRESINAKRLTRLKRAVVTAVHANGGSAKKRKKDDEKKQ